MKTDSVYTASKIVFGISCLFSILYFVGITLYMKAVQDMRNRPDFIQSEPVADWVYYVVWGIPAATTLTGTVLLLGIRRRWGCCLCMFVPVVVLAVTIIQAVLLWAFVQAWSDYINQDTGACHGNKDDQLTAICDRLSLSYKLWMAATIILSLCEFSMLFLACCGRCALAQEPILDTEVQSAPYSRVHNEPVNVPQRLV